MNKPFTLYYTKRENLSYNGTFLDQRQIKVNKIEDVRQISKPHKSKKNNNLYALAGDDLDVFCLGMVEKKTTKHNNTIYLGQNVFTTSKEELFIHFRDTAKKHMKKLRQSIKNIKDYRDKVLTIENERQYEWETKRIKEIEEMIKESQKQYKELIQKIKEI
jgi:hypothetical protein